MNTSAMPSTQLSIYKLFAGLCLSAALLLGGNASAQSTQLTSHPPKEKAAKQAVRVAVFPQLNSTFMKVLVENPNQQKMTLIVRNSKDEVVYRKTLSACRIYHGRYDVSKLENGNYTMTLLAGNKPHVQSFSVQTHQDRFASAL